MQELDISKKPLIKSITALKTQIDLYEEVTGNRPSRIQMSQSQFNWYVKSLKDFSEEMGWTIKYSRLDEPTFKGIPVYYRND